MCCRDDGHDPAGGGLQQRAAKHAACAVQPTVHAGEQAVHAGRSDAADERGFDRFRHPLDAAEPGRPAAT
jgi:hypothetical protein